MKKAKDEIEKLGIAYPQRRFGVIAIEKGFITVDQLWEALTRQKGQSSGNADRRHIGMILMDMGYLVVGQINEVLEAMKQEPQSREPDPKQPKSRKKAGKARAAE